LRTCAACGSLVPEPEARFCGTCGAAVPGATSSGGGPQPVTIDPAPGASTIQARKPGETQPFLRPVSRPTDSVATTLTPASVAADPGGMASVTIRARNTGTVVDELHVTVEGPIAAWAEIETPVLRLMPGTDATSTIRLRPPRVPLAIAGQHSFTVRVISRQHPNEVATESGVLTVGDVRALSATIVPATAKSSGTASYEVRVENQGNRPVDIALVASDPDEALKLVLDAALHSIPPGATLRAGLKASPRSGIALGAAERRSFRVDVMSEGQQAAQATAALMQTAQLPSWLPMAAMALAAVAVLAVAGFAFGILPPGGDEPTPPVAILASDPPSVAPSVEVPPSAETPSEPSAAPPSEEPSTEPSPTETPTEAPTPTPAPDDCARTFRWRETNPTDHVCVTRATVEQARFDESQADLRWTTDGTHTCIPGYVWREAFVGDDICVTPEVRAQTALDNERGPFRLWTEPNQCQRGFVWREALPQDHVCVEPWVREQAVTDNIDAPNRSVTGVVGGECFSGWVWRVTVPEDLVCVTPDVRTQAEIDNAAGPSRIASPEPAEG
jgi:hypothetical protein